MSKKKLPDLEALSQAWDQYGKDRRERQLQNEAQQVLTRKIAEQEAEVRLCSKQIDAWKDLGGEVCSACGQEVKEGYVDQHVDEIAGRMSKAEDLLGEHRCSLDEIELVEPERPDMALSEAESQFQSITEAKKKAKKIITEVKSYQALVGDLVDQKGTLESRLEALGDPPRTPDVTMKDADRQHNNLAYLREKMADLKKASNPFHAVLESLRGNIEDNNVLIREARAEIEVLDKLILHYNYIRKAYRDRNRIKKLALKSLVPYLNHRIRYFEQMFKLDTGLQFTETLGTKWRRWGYEQLSGGECKRIDCALMFALYQTLIALYGQQTNFCCMDEIDGSLDDEGVEIFAEVLDSFMSDSDSPSALFLISHKPKLRSFFPDELRVIKSDTYSRLQT